MKKGIRDYRLLLFIKVLVSYRPNSSQVIVGPAIYSIVTEDTHPIAPTLAREGGVGRGGCEQGQPVQILAVLTWQRSSCVRRVFETVFNFLYDIIFFSFIHIARTRPFSPFSPKKPLRGTIKSKNVIFVS